MFCCLGRTIAVFYFFLYVYMFSLFSYITSFITHTHTHTHTQKQMRLRRINSETLFHLLLFSLLSHSVIILVFQYRHFYIVMAAHSGFGPRWKNSICPTPPTKANR